MSFKGAATWLVSRLLICFNPAIIKARSMPNCAWAGRGILTTSRARMHPAAAFCRMPAVSLTRRFVHAPRIMLASSMRGKNVRDRSLKIVGPLRIAFHVRGLMSQLSGFLTQLCGQQFVLISECLERSRIGACAHIRRCPRRNRGVVLHLVGHLEEIRICLVRGHGLLQRVLCQRVVHVHHLAQIVRRLLRSRNRTVSGVVGRSETAKQCDVSAQERGFQLLRRQCLGAADREVVHGCHPAAVLTDEIVCPCASAVDQRNRPQDLFVQRANVALDGGDHRQGAADQVGNGRIDHAEQVPKSGAGRQRSHKRYQQDEADCSDGYTVCRFLHRPTPWPLACCARTLSSISYTSPLRSSGSSSSAAIPCGSFSASRR